MGLLVAAIVGVWLAAGDGRAPVRATTPTPSTVTPVLSRTNGPIVFVGNRRGLGGGTIHRIEPDGSGLEPITTVGDNPTPSPDGSLVAYQLIGGEIRIIGVDGSRERRIVPSADDVAGTTSATRINGWSADGSMLAFERNQDVWVVNADGTGLTNLTDSPRPITVVIDHVGDLRERPLPDVEGKAVWSPMGDSLAFVRGGDLYVMNAAGADVRRIFHGEDRIVAGGVSWSPDGETLAFSTGILSEYVGVCRDGAEDGGIHLVNSDGSGVRQLTTEVCDGVVGWSPAGDFIVISVVSPSSGLEVIRIDGTGRRILTEDGHLGELSPEGTEIAFRTDTGRAFVIGVDGTGRRPLTPRHFFVRSQVAWAAGPST
jgi:Tol biopolymer transport system component